MQMYDMVFVEWYKPHIADKPGHEGFKAFKFWMIDPCNALEIDGEDFYKCILKVRQVIRKSGHRVVHWQLVEDAAVLTFNTDQSPELDRALHQVFKPQINPDAIRDKIDSLRKSLYLIKLPNNYRGSGIWLNEWLKEHGFIPMWYDKPPKAWPKDMLKYLNKHVYIVQSEGFKEELPYDLTLYFKDKTKAILCKLATPTDFKENVR